MSHGSVSRARGWCYTLNNYTEAEELEVQGIPATYHVYGRERGDSGTPHLQGFLYFPSVKSFKQLKKWLPRAHVEIARDLGRAISYSKKDGDFWEQGNQPVGAVGKKCTNEERALRNHRLLTESLSDLVASGELSANQVPIIKKARLILAQEGSAVTTDDVRGVWFYGAPGLGKSHTARMNYPDLYLKSQNKWWDGYTGQEAVLLDDFDCKELGHHLKIWSDKWACTGEVKGGTVNLKHKVFIVTSNYHPSELWDGHMLEAILRRFKITHFNKLD